MIDQTLESSILVSVWEVLYTYLYQLVTLFKQWVIMIGILIDRCFQKITHVHIVKKEQ